MTRDLDNDSRNILEQRPEINFVEPEVRPAEIKAGPELETVENTVQDIHQLVALAEAVETLAAVVQARVDIKAENMIIKLDPSIDAQTIAAMRRMYPDDDPTRISYENYRQCKENVRIKGAALADQGLSLPLVPENTEFYDDYEGTKKALYLW